MAALTGLFIADSYKALLKTVDNDVLGAAAKEIVDGYGNVSGVLFDTSGNVTINGNFRALDAILDSSGSAGTAGQVLTTTGSTTQWQSLSSVSGVTGSGTAGYLPLWSTNSALTNSIALQSGSTITISGTLTATTKINTPTLQLTGGVGAQGTFTWNADEETVDLVQNGATLQLGQEVQIHCKNQTGALIPDGTPVYAVGTLGASGRILIAPMIANGSIDAKYFLGITTEDIANGDDGKVTTFGKIRGLNTAAYTEGQTLWVSSTVAGAFQTTRPLAPNLDLEVAIVINSHANNGTIFVRANNGHYLGTAHDVNISSVAENDLLVYKTNRWVNTKSIGDLSAANVTLSGYLRGPEVFVIDPAAHGNNEGLVQILGDLRVDGITTTINSTTISVSDKNITLAKDAVTAGDANGAGITIAGANATLTYESVADRFVFNKNIEVENSNPTLSLYYSGAVNNQNSGRIHFVESPTSLTHFEIQYNGATNTLNFNSPIDGTTGLFTINRSGNATASGTITASTFVGDLTGNADTADALSTAVNIALTGSVLGNADFDGSGDIIITTTTNHNHDDIYYTETESDNRFVNVSGDTMTGDLAISNAQPKLRLKETDTANLDKEISLIGGAIYIKNLNDDNTATNNMIVIDNSGNFTASGTLTAVGYNKTNWDAAYNDKINSGYFDSNTGDLVLTQQDNDTLTINFDDRYVIANTQKFNTNTYGVDSGAGTQRYKLLTTSGQTDQFFHITINRAYDYGDNDQTKQQIIYQRRLTNKNLRWRLDGDLTATSQVFIEIYAKANGDDEVWLVCADYARPQVYVEHDGFFWNGLTNADTPTGTLIKTTELTASNKPNWDEQVGLVKTTELYSDTTYLRGSAFVLAPNGSSYDTLVYRDGTNPHVLYAGGGTSTQWNTAYSWGDHDGLYAPISHTHPYLPLAGGTLTGNLNVVTSNVGTTTLYSLASIEGVDAHLDLISSADGSWGSAINFVEGTNATTNANIWSIARQTTGGDGSLNFNYGTLNNHNVAGIKVKFSNTGVITATGGNSTEWNAGYDYSQIGHLPLIGGTLSGALTQISDDYLKIYSATTTTGAGIRFSDLVPGYGQYGEIKYWHQDTKSYGSGNAFEVVGSEANMTFLVRGKVMYTEGIYTAPATGTGAGTRKDANWDAAYGWGDHADAGYLTSFDITEQTDPKYLRSDTSDTMSGSLTIDANGVGLNVSSSQNTGLIVDGGTNSGVISEFKFGTTKAVINTSGGGYFLGNIGIGVTSPAAKLHAFSAGTANVQEIVAVLGSTSTRPVLQFSESTAGEITSGMSLEYNGNGSGDSNYMVINSVANVPRFTVMSGGNVGIGTTAPNEKLQVTGDLRLSTNGRALKFDTLGADSSAMVRVENNYELSIFTVRGNAGFGVFGNSDIRLGFGTAHSAAESDLTILPSGNVGIGTTSPGHLLDVSGTARILNGIYFNNATGSFLWETGANSLRFGTNNTERVRIDASGNVGIGTTSPIADGLTIRREGSDRKVLLKLDRPNTAGLQTAMQFTVGNIMVGQIQHEYVASNYNHMSFTLRAVNGSNIIPLWLENSGNVGIGTTSPAAELDIAKDIDAKLRITSTRNGAFVNGNNFGSLEFYGKDTSGLGEGIRAAIRAKADGIFGVDTNLTFSTSNGTLGLDEERMRITSTGNVGIGAIAPSEKLEVAGNAILDASNANLKIKSGITGTKGDIQWTFNTDSTVYASVGITYDNRSTDGFLIVQTVS